MTADGRPRRACVIGWPVAHSLSPALHTYWLKTHGIAGEYTHAAVPPAEFADFVRSMPARGFAGGNVTVPHKIEALRLCDAVEPVAIAIGAVNTIWFEGGRLRGTNTDAVGFLDTLDDQTPGWDEHRHRPAVVIGAGGAARAIVWALAQRGFESLRIANRTLATAQEVAKLAPGAVAVPLSALADALEGVALVVNTSTLGMDGAPPLDIDLSPVRDDAVVSDLVYKPLETGLLRAARLRGLRTADGIGMLLHQGVPGFERWFGVRPTVTADLRAHVLDAMRARDAAQP